MRGGFFVFLTEVKITVTLILRSKTRIRRKFFSAAPFSCDRHNIWNVRTTSSSIWYARNEVPSHNIPTLRGFLLYRRVPILLSFPISGFRNFGDFWLFSSNFATTREAGTPMRCVRCCLKLSASFDM